MVNWLKGLSGGRLTLFIGAIILVCGITAAAFGVAKWFGSKNGGEGRTNPILVETTGGGGQNAGVRTEIAVSYQGEETDQAGGERVNIILSEGRAVPQVAQEAPVAAGQPLSQEEIDRILARLPEMTVEPGAQQEFKLPAESLPPPRTGETIQEDFPPPEQPAAEPVEAAGPLEVLRYSPEGEIPLAPFVNVTFNQPMVPLGTLEALAAEQVPVKIDPPLPGTWKWLGTKTLSFEYDSTLIDRLPMATEYVVTIPAGTKSAVGGELAQEVRFSFTTPPPKLVSSYPASYQSQPLDPLFFIAFDQRVDPQAVLDTVKVTANGKQVEVKLATAEEVEAQSGGSWLIKGSSEGRWLAFWARESLPADSEIVVQIGPGTPSAEGPLVTASAQGYSFHTYAPLAIMRSGCSWYGDQCPPLTPFYIEFNNPIDVDAYQESMLSIEPPIPGASIDIIGTNITIRGSTTGRTDYHVVVDGSIKDVYGQALGKDARLTFKVGSANSALVGPGNVLVTLDPASTKPVLTIYSINFDRLNVQAYRVEPSDWTGFQTYLRDYNRKDNPASPPGVRVMDKSLRLETVQDALTETSIDLTDPLDGETGHLVVIVSPEKLLMSQSDKDRWTIRVWVQVTQIGLDAFVDHSEMVAWTTALKDGSPLPGASIELGAGSQMAVTGDDGTARFALSSPGASLLVARQGEDSAILPKSYYSWGEDNWSTRSVADELRWYVFDDRAMYRPGEEVHVKGWIRQVGGKQDGDVGLPGSGLDKVYYRVYDPQGNELVSDERPVNLLGGFDFVFTLPENTNLGYAQVNLQARGNVGGLNNVEFYHSFQIQEFRRPEFEVTARNETTGPYFADGDAVVAVEAAYYAGGPLPNADVTWNVTSSPGSYSPPNWPGFTFGKWTPWWYFYRPAYDSYSPYETPGGEGTAQTFNGLTDAAGNHYLKLDFEGVTAPRPYSVIAEATVMDVNRQAWSASTSLLVHPSELYVGLRSDRTFVQRGDPLEIQVIVTDLDGGAIAGQPIKVQAARLDWKYVQGGWRQEEVDVQECNLDSGTEPVTCTFKTEIGGEYQITADVYDGQGRQNQSQLTRWVSGGQRPPARNVEMEAATLIPDQETYAPDDVAQILVQAPFTPAEGLLTVARSGILYTERFTMEGDSVTLNVPIKAEYIPNLQIQVDLVGSAPRTDDRGEPVENVPDRPAYASGTLNLSVPPLQRTLSLEAVPRELELEPGGETTIDVVLRDATGEPVPNAELAVVVVDEAILALTNYQLADPVAAFYQERYADVSSTYGRASIVLANPQALAEQVTAADAGNGLRGLMSTSVVEKAVQVESEMYMMAPAAAEMALDTGIGAAATEPIRIRSDFNPLATFAPEVRTDGTGRAQVSVSLPDNLTRYRVMVVAVAEGKYFGSSEANLTARLPLMVRPSAPRFLNFGDMFELPVVLQNQTDQPMAVDVVVRAGNIQMTGDIGQRVTVPARDRVEVRFTGTTVMPGTASFQIAAASGSYADAAEIELPVYTPATTEAFATYGVIDEGAIVQPVLTEGDFYPQFGGLDIGTSSTALQSLTDAVLYLVSYPFECSEQLASRILAVAALKDVLSAFSAEGLPSPEEMQAAVTRDIDRLYQLQNGDGGFPYWSRGKESIPYNTIHVAHALQRARIKGFDVPQNMQSNVLEYLRNIESYYPDYYSKYTRHTLSAYAVYVRNLMGDRDVAKAKSLYQQYSLDEMSMEAMAWIWQVLNDDPGSTAELDAIKKQVNNRAVETAGAANFTVSYGDQAYLLLHSNRRTDAVILDAMIAGDPQSDLIPKVVTGLLAHRTQGRWGSTQENVFVLLALDRYFNTYEAQTPDFVARIWLGDTYVGGHTYEGRTTERHETSIPMSYLVDGDALQDLVLSKDGPGRLYYRLGLRYAPTDLNLDPLDMGFVIQRSYEAVDDPEDVHQDSDGIWHIKAGARVRVKISMVADNRRYHVALVDRLPAGLEIINPSLAVSGDVPQDPNASNYRYGWWWWGTWYEHQNMRDDRAEAFTSLLWDGVYNYSYVARATTPGKYVAPPAKAEEMYSPEVFGRSGSDWVIVE